MNERETDDETTAKRAEELVLASSEMAGGAVGGALGLIGGPIGVLGGAVGAVVVIRAVRKIGREILERKLGPRQVIRAGTAYAVAANDIAERLAAGETQRDDGFFETEEGASRPEAEELLEGVLLHAANAYQERKLEYLGHLYAGIAFDPSTSAAEGHYLLTVAERLTYRQLALLTLLSREQHRTELIYVDAARGEGTARPSESLIAELDELGRAGVIGVRQDDGTIANMASVLNGGTFASLPIARTHPTYIGSKLHRLMRLDLIPEDTVQGLLNRLRIPR
jgi:hypothetical protein